MSILKPVHQIQITLQPRKPYPNVLDASKESLHLLNGQQMAMADITASTISSNIPFLWGFVLQLHQLGNNLDRRTPTLLVAKTAFIPPMRSSYKI
jgi:hypothetical protein